MMYDLTKQFWNFWDNLISETENSLYAEVESALQQRYGPLVDAAVADRVREEWELLKTENVALEKVTAFYQLTRWLKQQKEPYWLRGTAGSSFILHLLGITTGNPLPPHYYCPVCHSVIWCNDCADGFDLPPDRICEKDGAPLWRDGHNIPWPYRKNCYGTSPLYIVTVSKSLRDNLVTYFENHRVGTWWEKERLTISFTDDQPQLEVVCLLDKDQINPNFYDITPDAGKAPEALENSEIFFEDFEDDFYEDGKESLLAHPARTFGDLIAKMGLLHSTGAWDDASRRMVEQEGYSLSDLIAHREDVFTYLLSHGFSAEDAWKGMERVRKGKGLPLVTEEMSSAPDRWMLDRCQKVKYLFPKAHTVEYLLFCMRAKRRHGKLGRGGENL